MRKSMPSQLDFYRKAAFPWGRTRSFFFAFVIGKFVLNFKMGLMILAPGSYSYQIHFPRPRMTTTLTIPVKPYTLKYLACTLGKGYKLSKLDAFGLHLLNIMRRPLDEIQYTHFLSRYKASFTVQVNLQELNCLGGKLTAQGIVDFNNFVELIIKTEMCGFLDYCQLFEIRQSKGIQMFKDKYGMSEEDVAFDTLKKSYNRSKRKAEGLPKAA